MAKQTLAPPTADYLLALRRELETNFKLDDAQIDVIRGVRALTRAVQLDDKLRLTDVEVRDPLITQEIQDVVATLTLNPLKLQVTPKPISGDTGEQNATLREQWTEAILDDACRRGGDGHDAREDVVDGAAGDGGGWVRCVFQNDTWDARWKVSADLESSAYNKKTEDAKREAGQPYRIDCVDVRTLYPVWSAGSLTEVMVITKRPRNVALRQFRLGVDRDGRLVPEELGIPVSTYDTTGTASEVTVLEHWDGTYYSLYCEMDTGGQGSGSGAAPNVRQIKQLRHGYGRCPFFYAPGFQMNWQRGRKVAWSIAESKRWLVEFRSFLETLMANVAIRDAYKPVKRKRIRPANPTQGDDRKPEKTEYWEPRQIIELEDGEDLEVLDFGGQAESLLQMIERVDKQLQDLTTPHVSSDIGSSDPGSGFAISQILAETRIRQDPISTHVERMWTEVIRFIWKLGRDKIKEPIPVLSDKGHDGWLTVDPEKDLSEGVGLRVIIDPERATAKLIEGQYYDARMKNRTIGRHQAIEAMDGNPDEVDDDIELDRIRSSPEYVQRKDILLYQKLDRGDVLKESAMAAIASGELPGGGATGSQSAVGKSVVPDIANLAMTGGQGQPGAPVSGGLTPGENGTAVIPGGPGAAPGAMLP